MDAHLTRSEPPCRIRDEWLDEEIPVTGASSGNADEIRRNSSCLLPTGKRFSFGLTAATQHPPLQFQPSPDEPPTDSGLSALWTPLLPPSEWTSTLPGSLLSTEFTSRIHRHCLLLIYGNGHGHVWSHSEEFERCCRRIKPSASSSGTTRAGSPTRSLIGSKRVRMCV